MSATASYPPYAQIVGLLLQPFLTDPEALRVDCEYLPTHARVWVRVAFAEVDRERVLGGGNRHLYAVKTILTAAARQAGQTVYLDIHGGVSGEAKTERSRSARPRSSKPSQRSSPPKPQQQH
jgi:uncharacterized protein